MQSSPWSLGRRAALWKLQRRKARSAPPAIGLPARAGATLGRGGADAPKSAVTKLSRPRGAEGSPPLLSREPNLAGGELEKCKGPSRAQASPQHPCPSACIPAPRRPPRAGQRGCGATLTSAALLLLLLLLPPGSPPSQGCGRAGARAARDGRGGSGCSPGRVGSGRIGSAPLRSAPLAAAAVTAAPALGGLSGEQGEGPLRGRGGAAPAGGGGKGRARAGSASAALSLSRPSAPPSCCPRPPGLRWLPPVFPAARRRHPDVERGAAGTALPGARGAVHGRGGSPGPARLCAATSRPGAELRDHAG